MSLSDLMRDSVPLDTLRLEATPLDVTYFVQGAIRFWHGDTLAALPCVGIMAKGSSLTAMADTAVSALCANCGKDWAIPFLGKEDWLLDTFPVRPQMSKTLWVDCGPECPKKEGWRIVATMVFEVLKTD